MDIILVLAVTLLIEKSCSQTLSKSQDCFSNGGTLTLNCKTDDFALAITFFLNSAPQGSCVSTICANGMMQSGTTVTSMTISTFNDSAHSGSWTCKYGGSNTSNAVNIAETPCEPSNQSKKCGGHCLWGTFGAFIGKVVGLLILLIYYCIKDKKWTTFISWLNLHVSIAWILYVGLAFFLLCCLTTYLQEGWIAAVIACVILMIITVVAALIADTHGDKDDSCFIGLCISSIIGILYLVYLYCKNKKGKKKIDDKRRADLPEVVVVLATTIDHKGPVSFVWINEKGEELTVDETLQSFPPRLTSLSPKKKAALTDSGIYQCERKFENEVKDKINVVLHVSDICQTLLTVNPIFWAKQDLKHLHPKELKTMVEKMDKRNLNEESSQISVKWQFRETPLEKYKKLSTESSHIDLEPKKTGEYKCTVKLDHSKPQVYFFCVQYLDGRGSQTEKCIVIGVPSMLNKTGREDFE